MADIQLSIPYKNLVTREGRMLAWAMWPLWALLAPLCIVITLAAIAIYPAIFPPTITALLIALPLMTMVFGAVFTAVAQDDSIHVSKEGLYFPKLLMPRLGFAKYIAWDRLAAADIVERDGHPHAIRLVLRAIGAIDIPLKDVQEQQVEQLLLALELWGDKCELAPQLVAYQHQVQNAVKGIERISYTQMWEQELASRFTPTTFVPLEPGAPLQNGRLKVVRQLSFGGFSAIYLIKDELGKFMVAKEAVVPQSADQAMKGQAHEHFLREASILSKLSHPGIARVFDHFCEGGRNYILLEHIEGQNLRQRINQNGIAEVDEVKRWALELADIVDFLHSQAPPIVHRDLSPDNVMLNNRGQLVLIDFGAANHLVAQALGTLVGKQAYMPPEQLRGEATILSDYYSYAGTLHFLLTGRDPQPLLPSRPRQFNSDTPQKLDDLIARLSSFDAEDRRGGGSLKEMVTVL